MDRNGDEDDSLTPRTEATRDAWMESIAERSRERVEHQRRITALEQELSTVRAMADEATAAYSAFETVSVKKIAEMEEDLTKMAVAKEEAMKAKTVAEKNYAAMEAAKDNAEIRCREAEARAATAEERAKAEKAALKEQVAKAKLAEVDQEKARASFTALKEELSKIKAQAEEAAEALAAYKVSGGMSQSKVLAIVAITTASIATGIFFMRKRNS